MECCDITRNFLQGRKGKTIKVLVQGEGFRPTTGKLVDFNDSAMVLEKPDGLQWLIDLDYVKSVADTANGEV
jgi:hypothetical protein